MTSTASTASTAYRKVRGARASSQLAGQHTRWTANRKGENMKQNAAVVAAASSGVGTSRTKAQAFTQFQADLLEWATEYLGYRPSAATQDRLMEFTPSADMRDIRLMLDSMGDSE